MSVIVSSVFHVLCFPHEGNIVTIDQLSFSHSSSSALVGPSVPIVDNSQKETENIGVGMYPSLMGTFNFLAPISYINAISGESSSSLRSVSFRTSYFDDPWTLPSPTMSYEGQSHIRMEMSLSAAEIAYQAIQEATVDPDPPSSWTKEMDPVLEPIWVVDSSSSHDFLDGTFPSNEAILEAMTGPDRPWEDLHHRSYFSQSLIGSNKMSLGPP
jgi:hypothetical protein